MKKLWIVLALAAVLSGCAGKESFETMQDVYAPQGAQEAQRIQISLPKDAAASAMEGATGKIYFCDGYEIALETMDAGSVGETIRLLTGYKREELTVLETKLAGMTRYECAWVAVGESGDLIGRLAILDDGIHHYCLTTTALAEEAASLYQDWGALFESFSVSAS